MDNSRTLKLIDVSKLADKKVTIVGIGGVGGFVCEMLARAGIKHLKIIDFDIISASNCNRQIIALTSTIGIKKVDVMKARLEDINPDIKVEAISKRLTQENISSLIDNCDMCVDAIDSLKDKQALILYCTQNNIPIISAMGAGNRVDIPSYNVIELFETSYDGLAKALRRQLKGKVKCHQVVCSVEEPIKSSGGIGSISYQPAMCGCVLASYVVNYFLKGENDGSY